MMNKRPFVLIVEDDDDVRTRVACALRLDGYDVGTVRTTAEALAALACDPYGAPDAIVANARMSGIDAFARLLPRAPLFVVTAPVRGLAAALGAHAVLTTPLDVDALRSILRRRHQLQMPPPQC